MRHRTIKKFHTFNLQLAIAIGNFYIKTRLSTDLKKTVTGRLFSNGFMKKKNKNSCSIVKFGKYTVQSYKCDNLAIMAILLNI